MSDKPKATDRAGKPLNVGDTVLLRCKVEEDMGDGMVRVRHNGNLPGVTYLHGSAVSKVGKYRFIPLSELRESSQAEAHP